MKLGIRLESLGLPFRRGLTEVQRLSVSGVQVDAVGDLAPAALSQTGRREVRHLLRGHGLELTALGCPLRRGLDVADNLEARLEHIKNVMALAFDLGPRVVILSAGRVPVLALPTTAEGVTEKVPVEAPGSLLKDALQVLAQHGDRTGVILALETGLDSGETLNTFLARFDTAGLGVNLDPANLLMNGFDPCESARALHGRIVHIQAKDARRSAASRSVQEVALGHGDIDWLTFLGTLEEVEYRGWLTIERTLGDNRHADVADGVAFLRRFVNQ